MQKYNIIRLTRDVEVFSNTVKPKGYGEKGNYRFKREEYGSVLPKGTLMSEWYDSGGWREGVKRPRTFTEEVNNHTGYHREIPEDAFETVDVHNPQWRDFEFLHGAMMYGAFPLPNFEAVWSDDTVGMPKLISNIAAGGGAGATGVGHVHLPTEVFEGTGLEPYHTQNTRWARAFPSYTQGGAITGQGLILLYDTSYGKKRVPIAGRYALCKHDYQNKSTQYMKQRGDHRGRCSKCGLNMSVDSSD